MNAPWLCKFPEDSVTGLVPMTTHGPAHVAFKNTYWMDESMNGELMSGLSNMNELWDFLRTLLYLVLKKCEFSSLPQGCDISARSLRTDTGKGTADRGTGQRPRQVPAKSCLWSVTESSHGECLQGSARTGLRTVLNIGWALQRITTSPRAGEADLTPVGPAWAGMSQLGIRK
jgi:hypothetical protein